MVWVRTSGKPSPSGSPAASASASVSPALTPQPEIGSPAPQKAHSRSAPRTTSAGPADPPPAGAAQLGARPAVGFAPPKSSHRKSGAQPLDPRRRSHTGGGPA